MKIQAKQWLSSRYSTFEPLFKEPYDKIEWFNHKCIYRIIKQSYLLITRSEPLNNDRTHKGRVIVSTSNLRWCSDSFEIKYWDGEKVRMIFNLDYCDRDVISYATNN